MGGGPVLDRRRMASVATQSNPSLIRIFDISFMIRRKKTRGSNIDAFVVTITLHGVPLNCLRELCTAIFLVKQSSTFSADENDNEQFLFHVRQHKILSRKVIRREAVVRRFVRDENDLISRKGPSSLRRVDVRFH